jgi:hypothetical protein
VEFRVRDLFWLKPGVIGVLIFLQLKQEGIDMKTLRSELPGIELRILRKSVIGNELTKSLNLKTTLSAK